MSLHQVTSKTARAAVTPYGSDFRGLECSRSSPLSPAFGLVQHLAVWWWDGHLWHLVEVCDDLGVLQRGRSKADVSLWRPHESRTTLSWKKTCLLLLWRCPPTVRSGLLQQCFVPHTHTQCGWRTRSRPHLQTWVLLKTSGMWSRGRRMVTSHQTKPSPSTAKWKTGGEPRRMKAGIQNPGYSTKYWSLNSSEVIFFALSEIWNHCILFVILTSCRSLQINALG